MKKLFTLLFCSFVTLTVTAQDELFKLSLEVRADYVRQTLDGEKLDDESGFKGKYFNLRIDGLLGHGLSYSYRQRLNRANKDQSFFDATDWLTLSYAPNERWTLSAGKQVVAIGGYEYDAAPIDVYFYSELCSTIACYQFGASVTHTLRGGKDSFTAQVTQSPFRQNGDLYAYNLMWVGKHGWYNALWSVNMLEWQKGHFINYIALGNRFEAGPAVLELDFTNRATDEHTFFFRNCTVMGRLVVELCPYVHLFAKASYDVNHTSSVADLCVRPHTELTRLGGGVEIFPLKEKRNVRLHANYSYTIGTNSHEEAVLSPKLGMIDLGLTWRIDLMKFIPKNRR